MRAFAGLISILGISVLIACGDDSTGPGSATSEEEVFEAYAARQAVALTTVSGDCEVRVGGDDSVRVHLVHAYDPPESFEALLGATSDSVVLREETTGSSTGYSTWALTVPAATAIRFFSTSGDLEVNGVKGQVEATTAAGDISGADLGDLDVSSASGAVSIDGASGSLSISTASGDVDLTGVTVSEASSFLSASGDVTVRLQATAELDLTVSSASGHAVLDYGSNAVQGQFTFTARADNGRIVSPISFDSTDQFTQHGVVYDRKVFTRNGDLPKVTIGTASGTAELRQ